jgi:rfaE bifunctional protein kinase chain/domain
VRQAELSQSRLAELLDKFPHARIAVVGDFFLDKYLDLEPTLEETSVETGRSAHQVFDIRTFPGCAGTVMSNLAALGVKTLHAIGFRGNDGEGFDLEKGLRDFGCHTEYLHAVEDRRTPTYLKPRNRNDASLAGEHDRYDTKNRTATSSATENLVLQSIGAVIAQVDALMIMDQVEESNCGVITDTVRAEIARLAVAHPQVIFWADSRRRIHDFRQVIIKPNQFETVGREFPQPDEEVEWESLLAAAQTLRQKANAPVVITRGALGMLVSDPQWTQVPGVKVEVETDPTGAGDSASAGFVTSLCAGAELAEAAVVANLVASITIEQLATTGVAQPEQLPGRLEQWQQQQSKKESNE